MLTKHNPESAIKANELKMPLARMMLSYMDETNNTETRQQVAEDYKAFLSEQGLYDFSVICDETNNTAERIGANELWVDIAVQYEQDELFIYLPMRLSREGNSDE